MYVCDQDMCFVHFFTSSIASLPTVVQTKQLTWSRPILMQHQRDTLVCRAQTPNHHSYVSMLAQSAPTRPECQRLGNISLVSPKYVACSHHRATTHMCNKTKSPQRRTASQLQGCRKIQRSVFDSCDAVQSVGQGGMHRLTIAGARRWSNLPPGCLRGFINSILIH